MDVPEQNNRERFLKAYADFANAIFRHCALRVSSRETAKDLVQETFTRTWKCIADGQQIENIRAFLYRIANNLIVDQYRKAKTTSLDTLTDAGFDVADGGHEYIVTALESRRAIAALQSIEPHYRQVVIMRHVDGFSVKEIAEILDQNENVVSIHIHRGLKKLRELLQ